MVNYCKTSKLPHKCPVNGCDVNDKVKPASGTKLISKVKKRKIHIKMSFDCRLLDFRSDISYSVKQQQWLKSALTFVTQKCNLSARCESDNYPRSMEILQINQWATVLIPPPPPRMRQIMCIIDLCNPCICNPALRRGRGGLEGGGVRALRTIQAMTAVSSTLSFI